MLRCLFVGVNPDVELDAIRSNFEVYFTTLDIILAQTVSKTDSSFPEAKEESIDNHLWDLLCPGWLDLVRDIISFPNGWCLRDRCAHGEVQWDSLRREHIQTLIIVCSGIGMFLDSFFDGKMSRPGSMYPFETVQEYITHHHPIRLVEVAFNRLQETSSSLSIVGWRGSIDGYADKEEMISITEETIGTLSENCLLWMTLPNTSKWDVRCIVDDLDESNAIILDHNQRSKPELNDIMIRLCRREQTFDWEHEESLLDWIINGSHIPDEHRHQNERSVWSRCSLLITMLDVLDDSCQLVCQPFKIISSLYIRFCTKS
jgi:hypothetical protein